MLTDTPLSADTRPSRTAAASLVAANLVPLVGVLFFGWDLVLVLVLFWAENGVIGVYNLLRMALVRPEGERSVAGAVAGWVGKLSVIGFFVVHYGIFWLGHGTILAEIFAEQDLGVVLGGLAQTDDFAFGIGVLVVSHGVSFVRNFIGRREYAGRTEVAQMFAPYGRVVLLHVVILFGGLLAHVLGAPIVALALLVLLKTAADLAIHLYAHR